MSWRYEIADWTVESDLQIPGLLLADENDGVPDIIVRSPAPKVPTTNLLRASPVLHVARMGAANFDVPNVCSCIVLGGRYIGIAPCPDTTDAAIRCILLGPALAALSHQRNVLPLRGTCIHKGDEAIALIGPPGAGKTALAIGLTQYGWRFQSDGLVLIDTTRAEPRVWFSYTGALVWKHTITTLAIDSKALERVNPSVARYLLAPVAPQIGTSPSLRLRAVYVVRYCSQDGIPGALRIPPSDAENFILTQVLLWQLSHFYDSAQSMHQAVRKVAASVPCFTLARNRYGDLLGQLAPIEKLLCNVLV